MKKRIAAVLCALMLAVSLSSAAFADDYTPSGEYNIRVFAAAGGVADVVPRIAAQGLQEMYGATAIINNLTGANGAVAVADMNAYEPSIKEMSLVSMGLFTMGPLMNPELGIKFEDYAVVGSLIRDEFVLLVSAKSGIKSWEDLVAYSKDNTVVFASNTPGGNTHIVQTALFGDAEIDANALTSSGSNKDILAVLAGDAVCTAATVTLSKSYVESGELVPLLVFSEKPCTAFTGYEVPAVTSLGYNVCVPSINFLVVRAGVDKAEIDGFYKALLAYRETESFKTAAAAANYVPDATNADDLAAEIQRVAAICEEIFNKYY